MKAANSTEAPAKFYKSYSIMFHTVVTVSNPTPAFYEAYNYEDNRVLKNDRSWHMNFTKQKNRLWHNFVRATHRKLHSFSLAGLARHSSDIMVKIVKG
jgi:predicted GH43/DUF377 family glycosyl hydrolase